MLSITDLTYRIAGRVIFDRATVSIPTGDCIGIVGRNGTGKSTLLRLIAGELQPDSGEISTASRLRIGSVAQEAPDGEASLLDTVLAADTERAALLLELETTQDGLRIAEIHARLLEIDAASAPARAGAILSGLGFDAAAQTRPVGNLSGGFRMRVALAAALFAEPDLLLLDEPTNHLDIEAALWLESFLKAYRHTILLVSHDRTLLNAVAQRTLHVDRQSLTLYQGGYDRFERTRRERMERAASLQARQLAERRRIEGFIERFRAKATKARQAQSRIKMLEKMAPIAEVQWDSEIRFDFPDPSPLPPPILTMEKVCVGYAADRPVLRNLDLRIDQDDRIALLGPNGNGKSTLAKLISQRLQPMDGQVRRSGKLKVGYFAQHQQDELDLDATAIDHMARLRPKETETQWRSHVARFGLAQERAETEVGALSGGEKARLLFALMTLDAPHLLILDEPTNHLDVDSREALVQALNTYQGAVLLISHDSHLVRLTADRLWLVQDGTCAPYEGDLDEYAKLVAAQRRAERAEQRADAQAQRGADGAPSRRDERRAAAELRQALAPLRKAVKAAESEVEKRQGAVDGLKARLADPTLYSGPADAVTTVRRDLGAAEKVLAAAEETWMAAMQALEDAEQSQAAE